MKNPFGDGEGDSEEEMQILAPKRPSNLDELFNQ